MKKGIHLLLALLVLAGFACEKGGDTPHEGKDLQKKLIDTGSISIDKVVPALRIVPRRPDDTSRLLPPQPGRLPSVPGMDRAIDVVYAIDTSQVRTKIEPEFTDAGVGMLVRRTVSIDLALVESCIIPNLKSWVDAIRSGVPTAELMLPGFFNIETACSTGEFIPWPYTTSQRCIWGPGTGSTDPAAMFYDRLKEYAAICSSMGTTVPLIIQGLNYGDAVCRRSLGVMGRRITDASGTTVEYRIIFMYEPLRY